MIEYTVRLADIKGHKFEVECRISDAPPAATVMLPSWIPGSYLLREYARHVVSIHAFAAADDPVAVEKINKNTWKCDNNPGNLTITIRVHALDVSVRGAWLDTTRGFFNGPCLFLLMTGREHEPVRLTIERPEAIPECKAWKLAGAMLPEAIDADGFGSYTAADYDELIDHPFEIGDFSRYEFDVQGVPHSLVLSGRHDCDTERLVRDLCKICGAQMEFFGSEPPFDRYIFLTNLTASGYGGLEHRNSSSLIFPRLKLPAKHSAPDDRSYEQFLALASHEYFHTWHVKRTRPESFLPYRLSERNHTRLLWVFEGMTSYYQEVFLLRASLVSVKDYLRRLSAAITRVYQVPGRTLQSLSESSFDAWDVLYKPELNSVNHSVSYYAKGALIALCLDLLLRRKTESKISLDTVMRTLWDRYGKQGIGVPEQGVETLVQEIADDDYGPFFEQFVRGTADPPLDEYFSAFGIDLDWAANAPKENDAKPAETDRPSDNYLGVLTRPTTAGIECIAVLSGGPAEYAGLNPGDIIIAIDHLRVSAESFASVLNRYRDGDSIRLDLFRGDELLKLRAVVRQAPNNVCRLSLAASPDPAAAQRRQAWLGV